MVKFNLRRSCSNSTPFRTRSISPSFSVTGPMDLFRPPGMPSSLIAEILVSFENAVFSYLFDSCPFPSISEVDSTGTCFAVSYSSYTVCLGSIDKLGDYKLTVWKSPCNLNFVSLFSSKLPYLHRRWSHSAVQWHDHHRLDTFVLELHRFPDFESLEVVLVQVQSYCRLKGPPKR